jgi:hypothetical protein
VRKNNKWPLEISFSNIQHNNSKNFKDLDLVEKCWSIALAGNFCPAASGGFPAL